MDKDRSKALDAALSQIEQNFGKGFKIMRARQERQVDGYRCRLDGLARS